MTTERSFDEASTAELEQLQAALTEQMGDAAPDVFEMANAYIDKKTRQIGEPFYWAGKRYIWVKNERGNLCSEPY